MSFLVQKYGGTSVGNPERIRNVAARVAESRKAGHRLVVVVSAMSGVTDNLIKLAREVSPEPSTREMDMLLSTGEQQTIALTAMALNTLGVPAVSLTGAQAGIVTDRLHTKAKILNITPKKVHEALDSGHVVIVAGFQGQNDDGHITTLGRGGSDLTAIAMAAALKADACEIYTDVDGVFTTDPRMVPAARKIEKITSEEMLELAAAGAKVLYIRAVEYARRHGVTLHVRSSFNNNTGTLVVNPVEGESNVEEPLIAGVAADLGQAKITVIGVPDVPGKAAQIFTVVATAGANIDMIVQNVSRTDTASTDISFTLPKTDGPATLEALETAKADIGFESLQYDDQIGKLSLVGAGMRTNAGVSAKLFTALYEAGINIEMISTSEIRISVVTRADIIKRAVTVVHTAFDLDSPDGEAKVYGGTGR